MASKDSAAKDYPVPAAAPDQPHMVSQVINKSRFTSWVCRCQSREAARDFVAAIRSKANDATHNCWAFAAGPPGDSSQVGFSDDGEPHGTAGRPMLHALLHSGTGQICAVVSRWFGGVKLGTGGLVRAYQGAVLENLKTLALSSSACARTLGIELDYRFVGDLRQLLGKYNGKIDTELYLANAHMEISIPESQSEDFSAELILRCNGAVIIRERSASPEVLKCRA